ncbi:DUF3108 domain-containing protein [Acetobacter vaccinii]|uniref:DUF3108 domain-containing protein n=1 Tax=Acetobacter vaccinii TaxID=2592655 RepID=A0A5C1YSZ8_9PROT|nr:DUF3108 domain-containing protein [Acetobacter vaccinii]
MAGTVGLKWCSAFVLLGLLCGVGRAAADPLPQTAARYDVFVHGLRAMVLDAAYRNGDGRYAVAVEGKTSGLVGLFLPGNLHLRGVGTFTPAGAVQPALYDSAGRSHHQNWLLDMVYKGALPVVQRQQPPDPQREDVPDQARMGAVDLLAVFMQLLSQVGATQRCTDATSRIFDGERLSTLSIHSAGWGPLPAGFVETRGKDSLKCDFVFQQVQGFKLSSKSTALRKPQPGHVWFQNLPGVGMAVVRLELEHPKMGHIVLTLNALPQRRD